MNALAKITVGVVVERSDSASEWARYYWRPVGVLPGVPDTSPWTKLTDTGNRVSFYAGSADVELYRTEVANYRENLQSGSPLMWVLLRPVDGDPPYELVSVTADPAEGQAMSEAGANLVDAVPMPLAIQETIAAFVAEHHIEPATFVKRSRDRANPDALARRGPMERK